MADTDPTPLLPRLPALKLRLILPDEHPRFDQELRTQHYLHNATSGRGIERPLCLATFEQ